MLGIEKNKQQHVGVVFARDSMMPEIATCGRDCRLPYLTKGSSFVITCVCQGVNRRERGRRRVGEGVGGEMEGGEMEENGSESGEKGSGPGRWGGVGEERRGMPALAIGVQKWRRRSEEKRERR